MESALFPSLLSSYKVCVGESYINRAEAECLPILAYREGVILLITYFDEVKYAKDHQPYYWIGGIVVTAEMIWSLESKISELAKECFGSSTLSRETEFHATEIFHRKRNFKSWDDINARIGILKRLASILDEEKGIGKIHVRINPKLMVKDDYAQKAFMFFVERVEQYLRNKRSPGMLIGDRENNKIVGQFSEMLSQYRADGTPYDFGIKLQNLIDTVHFTDSHHSRMLQLADMYVWLLQFCEAGDNSEYPRKLMMNHVRENTGLLCPDKYKHWPTEDSWIKPIYRS